MAKKSAKTAAAGRIVVEQVRSGICCIEKHKRTLRALGLKRIRHRVELPDNPAVRGMVAAIPHLVRVVEGGMNG
jgi:large subunit ribosomal protein L30